MTTPIDNLRTLRTSGMGTEIEQGKIPIVNISNNHWFGAYMGVAVGLITFIGLWIIFSWTHPKGFFYALNVGITTGALAALLYYVYPVFTSFFFMIKHRQLPSRDFLNRYSTGQQFASAQVVGLGLVTAFNHVAGIILSYKKGDFYLRSFYFHSWWHMMVISFITGLAVWILAGKLLPETSRAKSKAAKKVNVSEEDPLPFGLWVGSSTGYLSHLWHRTGLAANQNITLSLEDAAQNILVLGGIGSGKTTRFMQPILAQLLDQECGGLLFDVKGDVKNALHVFADEAQTQVFCIGPGEENISLNLLAGLSPEMAASFLKSAFLLGGGAKTDSFWVDTATELCRNTLGVLSFIDNHYTLNHLYEYIFDKEYRKETQEKVNALLFLLEDKEQRLLKSYVRYHDNIFASFDEKVKSGVYATVAQVLSPFNHPELIDAFCAEADENIDMTLLFKGCVFIIDMPLSTWGLGAKVVYTIIKLRFFNMMQSRLHHPEWNQDNPVFFMCDEYQELISASKDGLSDLNFWDKSRSSKTIGIISSQSVSSFYAAMGSHDLAHAVIQNFRQKFCFRTEDRATLTLMNALAGQARVQRVTQGESSSRSSHGHTDGSSKSVTESREAVLDATLFRQLGQDQAIGLMSIQGRSMDDLLNLMPVYVN